jgi:hypothetical protein
MGGFTVRYVDYNVLVDGDRHLKGVIAEKVLRRCVRNRLRTSIVVVLLS